MSHGRRGPGPARRPDLEGKARSDGLAELKAIYAEIDAAFAGFSCDASTDCCRFGVTGREPYPTAVELALLEVAVAARGGMPKPGKAKRTLALADERRCAFLGDQGRCVVYAARPFGCRTFFCDRARGPAGEDVRALPKDVVARLSRAIADLSARFDPNDPGPRPLSRWTLGKAPRMR